LIRGEGSVHGEELHALVHDLQQQAVSQTGTRQSALIGYQPHTICHVPQSAACRQTIRRIFQSSNSFSSTLLFERKTVMLDSAMIGGAKGFIDRTT